MAVPTYYLLHQSDIKKSTKIYDKLTFIDNLIIMPNSIENIKMNKQPFFCQKIYLRLGGKLYVKRDKLSLHQNPNHLKMWFKISCSLIYCRRFFSVNSRILKLTDIREDKMT